MNQSQIIAKRKNEIRDMLKDYDNRENIRQNLIAVIMTLRRVPLKEAKNTKKVRPNEVEKILSDYDYKFTP